MENWAAYEVQAVGYIMINNIIMEEKNHMVKIKYQTNRQRWAVMQETIFIGFKNIKVW